MDRIGSHLEYPCTPRLLTNCQLVVTLFRINLANSIFTTHLSVGLASGNKLLVLSPNEISYLFIYLFFLNIKVVLLIWIARYLPMVLTFDDIEFDFRDQIEQQQKNRNKIKLKKGDVKLNYFLFVVYVSILISSSLSSSMSSSSSSSSQNSSAE